MKKLIAQVQARALSGKHILSSTLAGLLAILPVAPSFAQDLRLEAFAAKFERPLTMSVHQAPAGFREKLRELDAKTRLVSYAPDWHSFWEADVWVYFLAEPESIYQLGSLEQQAAMHGGLMRAEDFTKRVDVTLTGERPVLIKFINLFALAETQEAGCRAAVALYYDIAGRSSENEVSKAMRECPAGH
ncbi:hypothetical protein ACFMBG_06480 [Leisingera sp. D0M16]|uniref:hypothetical protein n=1 Tax=Leisingera coralii TaxID=3351347 RepID=UPI003B798D2D